MLCRVSLFLNVMPSVIMLDVVMVKVVWPTRMVFAITENPEPTSVVNVIKLSSAVSYEFS
jgi:hypothetical protein